MYLGNGNVLEKEHSPTAFPSQLSRRRPSRWSPSDLRAMGDRIEEVLEVLRTSLDRPVWEQVEDVVAPGHRPLRGRARSGWSSTCQQAPSERLVLADDLVGSLLVVHDLHPSGWRPGVRAAIDSVRPYLGSHGGDVEVLDVDGEAGVVRLRMLGSCDGCASSAVTLEQAVEQAVAEAAPEIVHIDVVGDQPAPSTPTIPVALTRKPVEVPVR